MLAEPKVKLRNMDNLKTPGGVAPVHPTASPPPTAGGTKSVDVDIRNLARNFVDEQVQHSVDKNEAQRLVLAEERVVELLATERAGWKKKFDSSLKEMDRQRKTKLADTDRVIQSADTLHEFLKACGYSTKTKSRDEISSDAGIFENLQRAVEEICEMIRYVMEERNQCILALSLTDSELAGYNCLSDAIHGKFEKLEQEILDLQRESKDKDVEIKDLEGVDDEVDQADDRKTASSRKRNAAPSPIELPLDRDDTASPPLLRVRKFGQTRDVEATSKSPRQKQDKNDVRLEIRKSVAPNQSETSPRRRAKFYRNQREDQNVVVVHDIQAVSDDSRVVLKTDGNDNEDAGDGMSPQYALTGFRTSEFVGNVPVRLIAEIQPLKELEHSRSQEQAIHDLRTELLQTQDSLLEKSRECDRFKAYIKTLKHMYHYGNYGNQILGQTIGQMMAKSSEGRGENRRIGKTRRKYYELKTKSSRPLPEIDSRLTQSTNDGVITSNSNNLLSLMTASMTSPTTNAKFPPAKTAVSRCLRCQKLYRLQDNHKRACRYHPKTKKKIEKYSSNGKLLKVAFAWDCCNHEVESLGCCADEHI